VDVLFSLDPMSPKRAGVEAALRRGVARGDLPVGSRIPSARELAIELGVARGTVTAAIEDLVADGILVARERRGVFVARSPAGAAAPPHVTVAHAPRWDLRPGRPETGSFPLARWSAALRRAAASEPTASRGDDDGAGSMVLRVQLAAYLARARGVQATPESIVVCAGYRSATTVLAVALHDRGATQVAIEDPGLFGIDTAWRATGMRVRDLPVDSEGAVVDLLDGRTDVAVLTPAHQFPLGMVLSADRRHTALAWAARTGGLIVEDDYDGEFRFDRRPVAALQGSAPDRVVYVGSTSKALDTRLRLGWMVVPPEWTATVAAVTLALTGGVPLLDQLALAELIRVGDYERHIRRQRREYARRRAFLDERVAHAGSVTSGVPAGLQALVPLPAHAEVSSDGVVSAGAATTHALSRYTRTSAYPPTAVVGFATPPRAGFEPAVEAFTRWLRASG
jgi:GntR family transcriptional regulator/MocR family aminotransferase